MNNHFKAVRPNGTDFRTGTINYASSLGTGKPIRHPHPVDGDSDASNYISISTEPGDCTGFSWPARLLEVVPVGAAWTPHGDSMPNKRAVAGVSILRELPAWQLFGPQGKAIVAIINLFATLDRDARARMYKLCDDAFWDAWQVASGGRAGRAGLSAARDALSRRLGGRWRDGRAAYGAALAVLLRHTVGESGFEQQHYDALVAPWLAITGQKAHPEDVVF